MTRLASSTNANDPVVAMSDADLGVLPSRP
jgi:hypothetical protein